ncbi:winged helix-turn-helix domain-containing protein, partial [Tahibacter caeni]|uniref:winged helix-turn-helix domain-containing protein n=1 Tax=Tahibacter caeni TaxID=1453545 RepID=UPI0021494263
MTPRAYRFEDLAVDLDRREVRRDGALLELAGLSFDLFAYLLAQGPRVVGFDELIAGVWAPAVVGEETVTQRVKLLRQSLGDDGRRPRYVRSVRGKGYQLCAAPQPLDAIPAAAPAQTPAIRIPGHLRRWLPAAAAAPLLAGLWLIARAPAPDAPHG